MGVAGAESAIFQEALRSGNYLTAVAAAHSVPKVSLEDALTLTLLAADQAPTASTRWQSAGSAD